MSNHKPSNCNTCSKVPGLAIPTSKTTTHAKTRIPRKKVLQLPPTTWAGVLSVLCTTVCGLNGALTPPHHFCTRKTTNAARANPAVPRHKPDMKPGSLETPKNHCQIRYLNSLRGSTALPFPPPSVILHDADLHSRQECAIIEHMFYICT